MNILNLKLRLRKLFILSSLLLLAACSTTQNFTTQTTSFQRWPADAKDQLYRFEPGLEQDLEKSSYVEQLRRQMWKTGLSEAVGRQKARFEVTFDYAIDGRQQMVREQDPFYDPFFYPSFNFGWGWGHRHPFYSGFGIMMAPQYRYVQTSYNRYSLHVSIRDLNNSGREVYQATVLADSGKANLIQVMPYLTSSVFDGFPGENGQVRKVKFEINKDESN
ncbi:MAG: DUF4136 domain-containing protein [Alcaligenaceae bacterium]|nr:DUF4136 domain-containing protein [Alcaligenaceae bacterium]